MATLFHEFSSIYNDFRKRYPQHPLNDELRSRLLRGSFPSNEWLRSRTEKMKDLMAPIWLKASRTFSHPDEKDSLDGTPGEKLV